MHKDKAEDKAALRGNPSYVWRSGQERRLQMIRDAAGARAQGVILENGCGVGMYVEKLSPDAAQVFGLEYDSEYARAAQIRVPLLVRAAGEHLPIPDDQFDLILSHEVIEHVQDDRQAIEEMVRTLKPGGRIVLFCPNRWYLFETHSIYWRGVYRFGNILLVNYLPRRWRDRLAPHVNVYTARDLSRLFAELPVRLVRKTVIYGAYDNIIARFPQAGKLLRRIRHGLEGSFLQVFGLSHFWVVEKI